jgi:hypothetical protein
MISAAGIKDQELIIIVSMMLIERALLRIEPRRVFQASCVKMRKKRDWG